MNSLLDIIKNNSSLEKKVKQRIHVNIFSNLNIHFIDEVIKTFLLKNDLNPKLNFYDINQEIEKNNTFKSDQISIFFWEIYNAFPLSINQLKKYDQKTLVKFVNYKKNEINFILKKVDKNKAIIFNLFQNNYLKKKSEIYKKSNYIIKELNNYLIYLKSKKRNLYLIDLNKEVFRKNYDLKNYNSTKSIYNLNFIIFYSKFVTPLIASLFGRIKKVIILDCDNTLWNGVVGEKKINFSRYDKVGKYFYNAQKTFKILSKIGAIICLCSKNNYRDVNNVLKKNKKDLISSKDILIKKINWSDKVDNIIQISKDLNLGLESFIFLDDSKFEIELVKKYLPKVSCFQVPRNLKNYSDILFEIECYFKNLSSFDQISKSNKTLEYRNFLKKKNIQKKYKNIDDFIKNLKIKILSYKNLKSIIPRASEMTLKTNQFNLTTKRYTQHDIEKMMVNKNFDVFVFAVKDIFGDNGITALVIVKKENKDVFIDSFLMSCRIIGRKIENSILKFVLEKYRSQYNYVYSKYKKSSKNSQVENFFSNNFFSIIKKDKKQILYKFNLKSALLKNFKINSSIYEKKI